ncbi:MAG TPA: DNA repair protein RecO [Methylomirabilota bacterium]|nr:DNA repair protein RecO [Methylomirabilota bacterium]
MQERAHGIILRVYPLTESSLIVQWLTAEQGRLSTAAKGARKQKSSFAGKLDCFFEADFAFIRSRRSHLHTLAEVSLSQPNTFLRRDLNALTQLAYAGALIAQTTEEETPLPEGHKLLTEFIRALQEFPASPQTLCAFELLWLQVLGQEPDLAQTRLPSPALHFAGQTLNGGFEALQQPLDAVGSRALAQFLHGFLIYHLGKFPPQRARALGATAGS